MKKEYSEWRQFLAWIGLVALVVGIPYFIWSMHEIVELAGLVIVK